MKDTALILTDGEISFEKLYYQAICLGETRKAEELYARYAADKAPYFWRDAFRQSGLRETVLMSAIVNLLDMPFGSYVFVRIDDERIEIAPWLYANESARQKMIDMLAEETDDADELRAFARTMRLTADYLAWLKQYKEKAGNANA